MREWLTFAVWQMMISRTTRQAFDTLCQWDAQVIRNVKVWPRFADLARGMFGNPFRSVASGPERRTEGNASQAARHR
jgi:hypothetical protein